jgi:lipoprotein-anchoring transpeptidase ErfK/SrfK
MNGKYRLTLGAAILTAAVVCEAATSRAKAPVATNPLVHALESPARPGNVGPGSKGAAVVRAQILLDRARFSPGEIDGQYGEDLADAIKGYQQAHNLKVTGVVDAATWQSLSRGRQLPLLKAYVITPGDVKGPFNPVPKDAQERAKMQYLGYESPQEGLGEKFHCDPKLLEQLNPGKDLTVAGTHLMVPNVVRPPAGRAVKVVVSKVRRVVLAYGPNDKLLAQYPATIGGPHDPLPIGEWKITSNTPDPWFYYQPERFWNADPNEATAKLPPGPNNPAGRVWMGLSKPHYGIHGSPDPGHVHHDESYGCIRLTNWDAVDLSHMVRVGTPAILEE